MGRSLGRSLEEAFPEALQLFQSWVDLTGLPEELPHASPIEAQPHTAFDGVTKCTDPCCEFDDHPAKTNPRHECRELGRNPPSQGRRGYLIFTPIITYILKSVVDTDDSLWCNCRVKAQQFRATRLSFFDSPADFGARLGTGGRRSSP